MADGEDAVSRKEKQPLLIKYDIPIDHLSYEYVEKCNDVKELEKIIKILRSGEEGLFPPLIESAEARLRQLKPESRVLRVEEPILTKQTASSEQWSQLSSEMEEWAKKMHMQEENFMKDAASAKDISTAIELPRVRSRTKVDGVSKPEAVSAFSKPVATVAPSKRSPVPRDYAVWEKYDADKELTLMEVEEQRQQQEKERKKREQQQRMQRFKESDNSDTITATTTTIPANLLLEERQVMATREKDKGNEFFKEGDYENAIKHYTASLNILPSPAVYNNRAMAEIKLHRFEAALKDCNEVLKIEPDNVKGLMRRGVAHQNRNNFQKAYEDFSRAVKLEPENRHAYSLAEQMKTKCQPKRKGFRMKIEEESSSGQAGTVPKRRATKKEEWNATPLPDKVFEAPWGGRLHPPLREGYNTSWPYPPPNKVLVNEHGLAKQMCNCRREPPYVNACQQLVCLMCHERRVLGLPPLPEGDCNHPDEPLPEQVTNGIISMGESGSNLVADGPHATGDAGGSLETKQESVVTASAAVEPSSMHAEQGEQGVKKQALQDHVSARNSVGRDQTGRSGERQSGQSSQRTRAYGAMFCPENEPVKLQVASKYICATAREERPQQVDTAAIQTLERITSAYEFTKLWNNTKPDPRLNGYAQILKAVAPEDLHTVIGNKLDGQMLSTMVRVLDTHFVDNPLLLTRMLCNLVSLPRFSISCYFLSFDDKKVVEQMVRSLQDIDAEAAHKVQTAFGL